MRAYHWTSMSPNAIGQRCTLRGSLTLTVYVACMCTVALALSAAADPPPGLVPGPVPEAVAKGQLQGSSLNWSTSVTALTGLTVNFDSAGSKDDDEYGDPITTPDTINCQWYYKQGTDHGPTGWTSLGSGAAKSCSFAYPGTFTVKLEVDDTTGYANDVDEDEEPLKVPAFVTVTVSTLSVTINASGNTVRGSSQTFTAVLSPTEAQLGLTASYVWKSTTSIAVKTENNAGSSWGGPIVTNGTIEVTATVSTKTATNSRAEVCTARNWADDVTWTTGFLTSPVDPRVRLDLGKTNCQPDSSVTADVVSSGPQVCHAYVTAGGTTWDQHSWGKRHTALYDSSHAFYIAQGSNISLIQEDVEIHEGIIEEQGEYTSHMGQVRTYVSTHPINSWAEMQLRYCADHAAVVAFAQDVTDGVVAKTEAARAASLPEPQNKNNAPIDFDY